jgi:hypothetical protein
MVCENDVTAGKMAEIEDELFKYDLDITAFQEITWKVY